MVSPKGSVFLFIGDDGSLKEEAAAQLASSLTSGVATDLDRRVFYGEETTARDIIEYADTPPFLAPKRLVIVKDADRMDPEERARLVGHLNKIPASTCLILDARDDSLIDELGSARSSVQVRRCGELSEAELSSRVRQALSKKGKTIEADALEVLLELQGANVHGLSREMDKLAAYVGDRPRILIGDVEALVGKSTVASAFDIVWATNEKDAARALAIIKELTAGGKRPHETVGLLCWHLKRLAKACRLMAQGVQENSIARTLKLRRENAGAFLRQARSLDPERVASKMDALLKADLDMKRSRCDPVIALEFAVIRLCLGRG
ncbi:MAG: DNA polymerase III subunit delta [Candidatus Omnitrophica bacterium]|nr:DNA polymerase III subunit delta [Candidatus Omnitrophota bacterium]